MTAIVVHQDDIDASTLTTPMVAPLPPGTTMAEAAAGVGVGSPKKAKPATENTNRPDSSRWTQQQLPVWEPMLTLNWAIALCFLVAATTIALGVAVLATSASLHTVRVVYDDGDSGNLTNRGEALAVQPHATVSQLENCLLDSPDAANQFHANNTCFVTITLAKNVSGPVHVSYELSNYYQHHRRFVSSMDRTQFTGEWTPDVSISACAPLETVESQRCVAGACDSASTKTRELFPCGIVANTMFNDIFWLHDGVLPSGERLTRTDLNSHGIARTYPTHNTKNPTWGIDASDDYLPVWNNPNMSRIVAPVTGDRAVHITSDYTNSTAWVVDPLDATQGVGVGVENEFWRSWVEGAAVQPFRKAYGRIERDELPAGTVLVFAVQSNFFVRSFAGKKALVVGELGWFGSENVPLGGFFVAVGAVFFAAGAFFALRKCRGSRSLGDATSLDWKHRQHLKAS